MKWVKMKKWSKINKGIILFAVIVVALTILLLVIVCNWNDFSKETNVIVTLIGIVLAFVSIFLSYKGLMVTNQVKEEIGLQQFKIKQHEEVAKIVHALNLQSYNIMLYAKGGQSQASITSNFYGLEELSKYKEHDFSNYKNCSVYYEGSNPIEFIYKYAGSPYLPNSVAAALIHFVQDNNGKKKQKKDDSGGYVRFCKIDVLDSDYTNPNPDSSIKICGDWEAFVEYVDTLINSIQNWYKEEYYNTEINLCKIYKINKTYPTK